MSGLLQVLLLSLYATLAFANTVTYDFSVGWVTAAPDGYSRPVIGVNGQWPIPIIEANVGDTVSVTVHNNLGNETTSLHFHGMFQTGTQASDGTTSVTQCPIQPGDSFTYTFVANPAGTHWYHSHNKGQYPDGLRGKMIIHDPVWERSLKIDQQLYLSMSDWYHRQMPDLLRDYMSPSNTNGNFPSPDTFLFNDTHTPFSFNFSPGKKYLLRIVNTAAVACGQFHIEGYTLSVVESDGVQMQPKNADTIVICAGQSYGVVVQGKTKPLSGANWIAKMTTDMLTDAAPSASSSTVIGEVIYDVLSLLPSLITDILTLTWASADVLDDFTLQPLDGEKLLSPVDNTIELVTNQTYFTGIGTRLALGSQPWVMPKVPSLFTALTTGNAASDPATYGPGANPWVVKAGQVVQIHLQNTHDYPHPMHLHGHIFQVVAKGSGTWNGNEAALPSIPLKRDNFVVPAQGYMVIRFKATNPGVWFFHCHIDFHLLAGMAATIVEAPDQLSGSVPPAAAAICSSGGNPFSGNCNAAPGNISASDAAAQCNTVINFIEKDNSALIS
ncbi:laccase-2 precursor [Clathrospora elynae]|uniref:Laccase-2 n=1 Tax=Clathrospora elynae TaxID=706981 RepID=A0A6A5SNG1_9PLEO|nr:laccase-2 precursor [Clathrospora elynae]